MALKIGDKATLFGALDDEGKRFSLSELLGKRNIVLYFYPKDDTPGCTKEACSFRDCWEEVQKLDATVIGVSSDPPESHASFKSKHKLPFKLVSDAAQKIRELYDAKGFLIPPRITYVIDKKGIIRHVYNSQMNAEAHAKEAINALKKIKEEEAFGSSA